jgi:hypothetical protein
MSFHKRWLIATRKSIVRGFSFSGISSRSFFVRRLTSPEEIFADGGEIFCERRRQPAFALERREFVIERRDRKRTEIFPPAVRGKNRTD